MRILFVTGEYPPMQGGVGAYTQELARALRALDVQVNVLTCEQAAAPDAGMQADGVRVLPAIRSWDWFMVRDVSRLAFEMRADWLHVQYQTAAFGMHPAINFAPRFWRRRSHRAGLRVAWTYHDLLVPYLFPKAGGRLRQWVTEQPLHGSDLVIVTNDGDRERLAAQGVRPACIPIGSNIQGRRLTPEEREARRALRGFGPDDLVLGYFGFLNRSKGGTVLVRTLHRLALTRPHVHLLMIGDKVGASDPTNYAYLQEVEALIRELGLAERVQWTGRQDDFAVGADLNACDVLVLPFTDGASLRRGTLMAGLANGCAIVTTVPQSPVTELVDGRDLLYVPPDDDAALALAVARVADGPELAASLREHARARSDLFSWAGIARAHLALYSARPPRSGS
jgi:glycosyltransferase involved in cell wall biosynthesis